MEHLTHLLALHLLGLPGTGIGHWLVTGHALGQVAEAVEEEISVARASSHGEDVTKAPNDCRALQQNILGPAFLQGFRHPEIPM